MTEQRRSILLVDGENIDATLGMSILNRRPLPEERPRWDRVLAFVQKLAPDSEVRGLFFLAANSGMPVAFVQAVSAIGFRPVPLSGPPNDKIVDRAILRTLDALRARPDDDVFLVSNDGDFHSALGTLAKDRRVGIIGFEEFRSSDYDSGGGQLERYDLEHDVGAFNVVLPRLRIIPIDEFDPTDFLA
jgi:uncharacterized protein